MFAHLQKLSLSYYDKTEVGRIMSRVQGDTGQLQEFMALVVMTLGDMLSLAGIVVMLLVLNLKLGLISMVTIPYSYSSWPFGNRSRARRSCGYGWPYPS